MTKKPILRAAATAAMAMVSIGAFLAPAATAAPPASSAAAVTKVVAANRPGDTIYGPTYYGCADAPHTPIARGYTGASVRLLQCMLNHYSLGLPELAVDGIFGSRTAAAVMRFKLIFFGRAYDSIVGPNTWRELLWVCGCGGA